MRTVIVADAPLSTTNHATEKPESRAQNILWQRLSGRPPDEIVPALKDMLVRVPGESLSRPAREVMGEDSRWFAFQAITLYQLDPDLLAAVLAGPQTMLSGYDPVLAADFILFAQGTAELGDYGLAALGENEVEGRRRPGGKRPAKFAFNLLHAQRMVGPRVGSAKN